MSTKIHDGYRLADGISMFGLLHQLRTSITPVYERLYTAAVVRQATFDADDILRGATNEAGTTKTTSPLTSAVFAVDRAHHQIAKTGQRNPRLDFNFEVVAMPDPHDHHSSYAIIYTEQDEYRKVWQDLYNVEPFGYWNNTDRPDDITDDEWDSRRRTWNRVIPDLTAPSTIGWAWSLLGDMHQVDHDRLIELASDRIPTKPVRALRIARTEVVESHLPHGATYSQIVAAMHDEEVNAEVKGRALVIADELADLRVEDLEDIGPMAATFATR